MSVLTPGKQIVNITGSDLEVDAVESPDNQVALAVAILGYPAPLDVTPGLRTTSSGASEALTTTSGSSVYPWGWIDCDGYESLHITGLASTTVHSFWVKISWYAGLESQLVRPFEIFRFDGATPSTDGVTRSTANLFALTVPVRGSQFRIEFRQSSGGDIDWNLQYHLRT